MHKICGPKREREREKRFIPFASHPFDLYPPHQRISSKPPHGESSCLDIVLQPSACSHFILSLYHVQTFPLDISGRDPIFLCPPSPLCSIFAFLFVCQRTIPPLFFTSSRYAGRLFFCTPFPFFLQDLGPLHHLYECKEQNGWPHLADSQNGCRTFKKISLFYLHHKL